MSWSYNVNSLATNQTYQVRMLIGDTIPTDAQLQDEEIAFTLTLRANIWGAAAECCRSIASNYSREADSVQGELRTIYSARARAYAARATAFDARASLGGAGLPYAGGISVTDKQNQEQNTDRVAPQFNLGMDDSALPVPSVGNETLDSTGTDNPLLTG